MAKRPKKQRKTGGDLGSWIDEENLQYEARKLLARIRETARKAQDEFWEIVIGSFPEIVSEQSPDKVASAFTKACREAVTDWYVANAKLEEKILSLIRSGSIKPHEKKVLIGQNDEGWWAANPEPAIRHQDIDKMQVIFSGLPSKDELMNLLTNLEYKKENILEGILRIK